MWAASLAFVLAGTGAVGYVVAPDVYDPNVPIVLGRPGLSPFEGSLIAEHITTSWEFFGSELLVASPEAGLPYQSSESGTCEAFVEEDTLLIIGDETADTVGIVGTERGVQVTCDGATDTFENIGEITVEAGNGDDIVSVDDINGLLGGIAINIFGQEGPDKVDFLVFKPPSQEDEPGERLDYDGGPGEDVMQITTGQRDDRFDIAPGSEGAGSVEIHVTDIATGTPVADIRGSALEFLTVKGGEGFDLFELFDLVAGTTVAIRIFGQGGDDQLSAAAFLLPAEPSEPSQTLLNGGSGVDKFTYFGASAHEQYKIDPALDQEIPDPQIRVTDLATGGVTGDFRVQETEEIVLETGGGDDHVAMTWDAALMSGLSLVRANLGKGDDAFAANLLPVRTAPRMGGVQTAAFEVFAGNGDDEVAFHHSAGSWFDVSFTADLGGGDDTFNAELGPPPDDGLPGPDGVRMLEFNMVAGDGDDFVAVHDRASGAFFDVVFEAVLGRGDDTFEAMGEINPCVLPGPGFDVARVTRPFLPFVAEFEKIVVLEEGF